MKKLLILSFLFFAISCAHVDQKFKVNLTLGSEKGEVDQAKKIRVLVIDDRKDKEVIGDKKFGSKKIKITNDENLAEVLQSKISETLLAKGFQFGGEKTIEIHLKKLKYRAKRGFLLGDSAANCKILVLVKGNKSEKEFSKNFKLSVKKRHFIAPLESTDNATINALLTEIIDEILSSDEVLEPNS